MMFTNLSKKILLVVLIIVPILIFPEIISIPADYPTIQLGINQTADGDTILVSPGIYYENIDFAGKSITVASKFLTTLDSTFISQTIINGSNASNPDTTSTVIFCHNENEDSVLLGFTIKGGGGTRWIDPQYQQWTWFSGGGIFMYMSSPTIKHNYIKMNIVTNDGSYNGASGGGFLCFRGNPIITNNIISQNQADYGAGLVVDYSGAIIKNNLIINNFGGQQYGGGGIYTIGNDSEPFLLVNNTIYGNHSETNGGAIRLWSSAIDAVSNIIWGNTQNSGNQIHGGGTSSFSFCDIEGGFTGEGNIDLDPLFSDLTTFLLEENSPCIDAGNPDEIYNDIEDTNNPGQAQYPAMGTIQNDMGVYGGPFSFFLENTSVNENELPADFSSQIEISNFPNPFKYSTTISFEISNEQDQQDEQINLNIYNIKGQRIKKYSIYNNQSSIVWDGKDGDGKLLNSGIYFYRLQTTSFDSPVRKMILKR